MTDWKAWKMVQAIGSIVCGMKRKHKWGRAYRDPSIGGNFEIVYLKRCRRCKTVAPVKRRRK